MSAEHGATWTQAMRLGDFEAAWAVSDAVLAGREPAASDDPALPYHRRWVWDGRPLTGRDVVVRCYHGLGDTLQFCRYLAPLRALAGHVTLEVQAPLLRLLAGFADVVVAFDPARPLPPGEATIEIMELAHALRLVPGGAPYLSAPPGEHSLVTTRQAPGGVGVCWQAGGWDAARDVPVAALEPCLGPMRQLGPLVSLQRGPAAIDAWRLGATDPLCGAMDVAAMASLVAGLRVVVTVDTMVAHLTGSLGVPCIVLLQESADWRWGLGERCAWYGSARLARQTCAGNWQAALEVASGLLHRDL